MKIQFSSIKQVGLIWKSVITKEADSRIALHAANSDVDCMIVSKDTDVFLLLVYAFYKSHFEENTGISNMTMANMLISKQFVST